MACNSFDEPGSAYDILLLTAVAVATVPFVAANAVIFIHRKRGCFQAQGGALLTIISSIAGLTWIASSFVVNFHFPRRHRLLLICPLWSFWLHFTFGFWLWLVCQIVRIHHLLQLCRKPLSFASRNARTLHVFLSVVVLWIPGLVFAIVATDGDASKPSEEGSICANCKLQHQWKICTYAILPLIYFVILGALLYFSRSCNDYLMAIEQSHSFEYSLVMAVVIFLLVGATFLTGSETQIPGRLFLTFCICFLVFVNFWVRLGWPVYICSFKKGSFMDKFEEELQICGAQCLEYLSLAICCTQGRVRTSSLQYKDWVLRAIDAATVEALELKERTAQLQQRKLVYLQTKNTCSL